MSRVGTKSTKGMGSDRGYNFAEGDQERPF